MAVNEIMYLKIKIQLKIILFQFPTCFYTIELEIYFYYRSVYRDFRAVDGWNKNCVLTVDDDIFTCENYCISILIGRCFRPHNRELKQATFLTARETTRSQSSRCRWRQPLLFEIKNGSYWSFTFHHLSNCKHGARFNRNHPSFYCIFR